MEKLQKALRKARRDRGSAVPASERAAARGIARPVREKKAVFPPIWDKLKPMEPDNTQMLNNRVMTLNAQPDAIPLDVLRTKIWLLMRENGWTRLAITSPKNDCGKTMTACNLAVGFSRQPEVKAIFLDLDLRRPGVADTLVQSPEHDVRDLLTGQVTAEAQMVRLRTNVAISMAKRPVVDPTQLLLSRKTSDCFDALQSEFQPDIMIFDLPPMLVTDDARAVLRHADCALIVAAAERTRISQLDVCERDVSEYTNVLGVVLNNCRHMDSEDDYSGY